MEARDQGDPFLVKEMTGVQKEEEEEKPSKNESHRKAQEVFQTKELERCGKILWNKLSEKKRRNMRKKNEELREEAEKVR